MIGPVFTIAAAVLTSILGLIYLFRPKFMDYHQKAVQKEWNELSPGIQILILALMRTTSGGLLSVAVAIVILQVQFIRSHHLWIAWTILIIGFLSASISLYGMSMMRRKTPGRPLIIPVIIIFILLLIGFLFNIMG